MPHVIWDWNGTLFDDLTIVVQAVNATLEPFGAGPIDADGYRDHYTRPVHLFYDKLLNRPISGAEWDQIDRTWHGVYRTLLHHGDLAHDARTALETVRRAGSTQSLLSMWWHTELVPMVRQLGVDHFMTRIEGHRGEATGETKAVHLEHHLEDLAAAGVGASTVVMIGDSLDDARASREAGVAAILYDGGSHHRHELEAAGVPVADSLLDAVRMVLDR
jgi:phosphoglycolate phosphatase-like HAD superfamily hydrolase